MESGSENEKEIASQKTWCKEFRVQSMFTYEAFTLERKEAAGNWVNPMPIHLFLNTVSERVPDCCENLFKGKAQ